MTSSTRPKKVNSCTRKKKRQKKAGESSEIFVRKIKRITTMASITRNNIQNRQSHKAIQQPPVCFSLSFGGIIITHCWSFLFPRFHDRHQPLLSITAELEWIVIGLCIEADSGLGRTLFSPFIYNKILFCSFETNFIWNWFFPVICWFVLLKRKIDVLTFPAFSF